MEFLELVDNIQKERATVEALFNGRSDGQGVRSLMETRGRTALYMQRLTEATLLMADVFQGRRPAYLLREAMTTSDFPYLFGDILDRQLLAAYREWPTTWQNYIKRATVRDFRTVKRYSVYGATSVLEQVPEQDTYPQAAISENNPLEYAVKKYGRRLPFSWEAMVNDDLEALQDAPGRFGRAARRTEERFGTGLFVDANGPHASVYTVGNKNIITGNPPLSIAALQTAFTVLGNMVDEEGEPVVIEAVELVVPPALEVTGLNILNALQLELAEAGGTSNQKLLVQNWMRSKTRQSVNPYIPLIASSANGSTSWFLFASANSERPAAEMGFLRGHTEPEIFIKEPNQRRVGGGVNPMDGDFDSDSIEYKVRHVLGGAIMDPKMTVGSNGSGN